MHGELTNVQGCSEETFTFLEWNGETGDRLAIKRWKSYQDSTTKLLGNEKDKMEWKEQLLPTKKMENGHQQNGIGLPELRDRRGDVKWKLNL